jgi:hypothetical protein
VDTAGSILAWDSPISEEFYNETGGNSDDYDASELINLAYTAAAEEMAELRAALKAKMLVPAPPVPPLL